MRNTLLILRYFHEAIFELEQKRGNFLVGINLEEIQQVITSVITKIEAYEEEINQFEKEG